MSRILGASAKVVTYTGWGPRSIRVLPSDKQHPLRPPLPGAGGVGPALPGLGTPSFKKIPLLRRGDVSFTGPPVEVGVTMYVLSISSLSEVKMVLVTCHFFLFGFKKSSDRNLVDEPRPGSFSDLVA